MGFSFSDLVQIGAPVVGGAAGTLIGGPTGGALGAALGAGVSGNLSNQEAARLQREANEANIYNQKEFAQYGIRWKVNDSIAAGIHPLVGLGAPTSSFQASVQAPPVADLSGIGQDISRALQATRTGAERDLANLQIQGAKLDLEGKALDNQIKNSQLQKMNQVGPAFPGGTGSFISGQGAAGPKIMEKPLERTASLPGAPHSEPGAIPDVGWAVTADGGVVPVPSQNVKERIEDSMPQEWGHYIRNNIAPNWGGGPKPPKSALPKGAMYWKWDYSSQKYYPKYPSKDPPATRRYDLRKPVL